MTHRTSQIVGKRRDFTIPRIDAAAVVDQSIVRNEDGKWALKLDVKPAPPKKKRRKP